MKGRNQYVAVRAVSLYRGLVVPVSSCINEISESVIEVSTYAADRRENRLNHRADVGDVFCHSLTCSEEISFAHIHKKTVSPSLSLILWPLPATTTTTTPRNCNVVVGYLIGASIIKGERKESNLPQ